MLQSSSGQKWSEVQKGVVLWEVRPTGYLQIGPNFPLTAHQSEGPPPQGETGRAGVVYQIPCQYGKVYVGETYIEAPRDASQSIGMHAARVIRESLP